jgi:hypothetical protein
VLQRKADEARRKELDLQGQVEQLEFELDMKQRNIQSSSQNKDAMSKKEEEIMRDMNRI